MATSPSSPTGWASSQSCGRPSSRSGAMRMVRLPSRMFLLNSWPTSVSCSLISLMRARVSSSRSTPARRKSVRVLSSRRAACGSSSAASRAAITSYSSRSSWNSVPILCTSWTAASPRERTDSSGWTSLNNEPTEAALPRPIMPSSQICSACSAVVASPALRRRTASRAASSPSAQRLSSQSANSSAAGRVTGAGESVCLVTPRSSADGADRTNALSGASSDVGVFLYGRGRA